MGGLLGKVTEHIKGSVSGEYHHFISGGGDPVMWFNGQLESASGHAAQGAAEAVAPIIRGEIDYMFDQKIGPMLNRATEVAEGLISKGEEAAEKLVKFTLDNLPKLLEEIKQDLQEVMRDIFGQLDSTIQKTLQRVAEMIQQAIAETLLGLRGLLGEINQMLERTIRQVGTVVMQVLAEIRATADAVIDSVRAKIIEPAFEKLNALEAKFFADLNQVIDRLEGFAECTQDSMRAFIDTIRARLMILNPFDPCVKKFGLFLDPNLSDIETYWLETCHELQQLETQFQDMDPSHIMGRYADLASTAKAFACLHRSTPEAERFYLRDWAEFRRLSRLWGAVLPGAELAPTGI